MTNCQIEFKSLFLFEIDFKVFKNNNHEHGDIRCWTAGTSMMNRNYPNWHWNQPPLLMAPSHYLNQCWLNHQWGLHLKTISQGMLKISFWTNIDQIIWCHLALLGHNEFIGDIRHQTTTSTNFDPAWYLYNKRWPLTIQMDQYILTSTNVAGTKLWPSSCLISSKILNSTALLRAVQGWV